MHPILHCSVEAIESDGTSNQNLCEILTGQQQDNANPSCLHRSHLSICKKVKSPVIFDLIGKHQSEPTVTTTHETHCEEGSVDGNTSSELVYNVCPATPTEKSN